ncbi:MAG TPA: MFS transporter, partial [Rhodothermales bacterium]|nr:MFS transporter [Rhodothermales bacterium]
LLGGLLKKTSPARVLLACIGIGIAGALIMIFSPNLPVAVCGLFLIGVGLAAGFPVVLGYVGDSYANLSGTAFSIVLLIALIGGSVFPYVIGLLGEAFGLRASFTLIPISLILMALLFAVVRRRITPARSNA